MRTDASKPDPCYMGFKRDEVLLHVSSFSGDGVSGGVVYVAVDDVPARRLPRSDSPYTLHLP
jgi:hypothetical protein